MYIGNTTAYNIHRTPLQEPKVNWVNIHRIYGTEYSLVCNIFGLLSITTLGSEAEPGGGQGGLQPPLI